MVESAMSKTMMEEVMATWSEGSEDDDLVRELLDDVSPLLMLQHEATHQSLNTKPSSSHDQAFNKLIPNIYSGPTISDIENALSFTNNNNHFSQFSSARYNKSFRTLSKLLSKVNL